jgi:hypothetical protein
VTFEFGSALVVIEVTAFRHCPRLDFVEFQTGDETRVEMPFNEGSDTSEILLWITSNYAAAIPRGDSGGNEMEAPPLSPLFSFSPNDGSDEDFVFGYAQYMTMNFPFDLLLQSDN